MRTSFEHWLYFGQALASRHPLFFQWVTRERQREKELFWVEDLTWDSLVVELPPHVHLGGAITDTSSTSGIPSWKRGLLQMDNINFVDVYLVWYLDTIVYIVSFIWKESYFEAWPLYEVNYFTSDGIFVECPGELLHSGYNRNYCILYLKRELLWSCCRCLK